MTLRSLRRQFPALRARDGGPAPVYLDSACMSLVPQPVLDAMLEYYRDHPGCGGRSFHRFAEAVSQKVEGSREEFAKFLHAPSPNEIVFLRNSTEAINLVAQGLNWKPGDRVIISDQEHNSNLIVWQRLRDERGIHLDIWKLPDGPETDLSGLEALLTPSTKIVSLFHTSNLDGRTLPIREIAERAHARGARVLVDGCQAAPHLPVDLAALGVDYYAISGHKMLGPTGTGVLAANHADRLKELRPLIVGGETVEWSTLDGHVLRAPPKCFEAGLQNYSGIIGAGAAVRFLKQLDFADLRAHDAQLNRMVTKAFAGEKRIRVLGPEKVDDRPSILAFALEGIDPSDGALFLDESRRVMVRAGMHCVHSWYKAHGLTGNLRASFYLYNNRADAQALASGVAEMLEKIPSSVSPGTAI